MSKSTAPVTIPFGVALALASLWFDGRVHASDRHHCCVCARQVCRLTVDQEEIKTPCFDCECKDVCIPPVRFWWECGPIRRCGKVRSVSVLTFDSKTEQVATYDWSVATICVACYRRIHHLRCQELAVDGSTPAEQVGLPVALPDANARLDFAIDLPQGKSERDTEGLSGLITAPVVVSPLP